MINDDTYEDEDAMLLAFDETAGLFVDLLISLLI